MTERAFWLVAAVALLIAIGFAVDERIYQTDYPLPEKTWRCEK